MATIDYKQKIKDYMNSSEVDTLYKSMLNNLFPELAVSEDERVKEELKEVLGECLNVRPQIVEEKQYIRFLAWLEKHSEQKTVDEIAKEVCKNKESAVTFLKSAGIINEKGELAEQYRQCEQESIDDLTQQEAMDIAVAKCFVQGEQKPADKVEPKFKYSMF